MTEALRGSFLPVPELDAFEADSTTETSPGEVRHRQDLAEMLSAFPRELQSTPSMLNCFSHTSLSGHDLFSRPQCVALAAADVTLKLQTASRAHAWITEVHVREAPSISPRRPEAPSISSPGPKFVSHFACFLYFQVLVADGEIELNAGRLLR